MEALSGAEDLPDEDRTEATTALEQARRLITTAQDRAARVREYVAQASNGAEIRQRLTDELSAVAEPGEPVDVPETSEELRNTLGFLRSERSALADQRAELLVLQTDLSGRSSAIATEIAEARATLVELSDIPPDGDDAGDDALARAADTLRKARLFERRAAVEDLQRELATIPQRQPIVAAQLALANAKIVALDAQIGVIQQRLSDARMDQADEAMTRATEEQSLLSGVSSGVDALAAENVALASALQSMADGALAIEQDIATRIDQTLQINSQAETVERVVATGRITEEVGALLRQVRSGLPNIQALRQAIADAVEARVSLQLNLILWQDRLRTLNNSIEPGRLLLSDTAGNGRPSPAPSGEELSAAATLADHRQQLLNDLIAAGRSQSDRLTDQEISVRETLTASQALQNTLDRRLLWLPSSVRPLRGWAESASSAAAWLSSPGLAVASYREFTASFRTTAAPLLLAGLLAAALLASRRYLRASLEGLNDSIGKVARDRYLTTPLALINCMLLAAPAPLIIGALGAAPILNGAAEPLTRAVAAGLIALAIVLFVMLFFRVMRQPDGVFASHFSWSDKAIALLRRHSVWFAIVQSVAVFALVVALASGRPDLQHAVGMPAFIAASAAFAVFGYHVFKPETGLASLVVAQGLAPIFSLLGLFGVVLAPFAIGALPLFGYFDTAVSLQTRVLQSAAVLVGIAILYGVLRRQLLIAQRRLALRRALERRAQLEAERAENGETEDGGDTHPPALEELAEERQRISNQTRRVLLYLAGFAAVIAMWTIWATILPALGIANEITLWTGADTIAGVRTERPVTLWNLFLFFAFIAAGFIAAYNIRGVLEIGPFQRIKLSPGSRYAIDTIIGYVLVGAGIVAGFLQLGLDWSRLQWIIAALGVGLGFGLQEIVANFISGLIILFERPVRVGDMVTIGELEGTVSNIAIRATTITDFDNREVLLPNKSIITENVTNWTLRDSMMRIIINIGVAYGSDLDKVRDLLADVANAHEDVLETPHPRIFFMNHGDSSLDFEVRVYISNPHKRYRVRHELNTAINKALAAAGIEIPFPQRDVHMRTS